MVNNDCFSKLCTYKILCDSPKVCNTNPSVHFFFFFWEGGGDM